VTGYPGTQTGWDACTGWGVFDWNNVLQALTKGKTKEKEKEKDKEHKDKEFLDKVSIKLELDTIIVPGVGGAPPPQQVHWLQTMLMARAVDQLGHIAQGVGRLEQGMNELRAFIRPEERPAVGQQALKQSAEGKEKKPGGEG
jgi:hypothetical protein